LSLLTKYGLNSYLRQIQSIIRKETQALLMVPDKTQFQSLLPMLFAIRVFKSDPS